MKIIVVTRWCQSVQAFKDNLVSTDMIRVHGRATYNPKQMSLFFENWSALSIPVGSALGSYIRWMDGWMGQA